MKRITRKDGLTSENRKELYTHDELKALAMEAYEYFQENGWEPLTGDNMQRLRNGTEVRCCEYMCGCFGQIEKIMLGSWCRNTTYCGGRWRMVYHTNHGEGLGNMEDCDSREGNHLEIVFCLIRKR